MLVAGSAMPNDFVYGCLLFPIDKTFHTLDHTTFEQSFYGCLGASLAAPRLFGYGAHSERAASRLYIDVSANDGIHRFVTGRKLFIDDDLDIDTGEPKIAIAASCEFQCFVLFLTLEHLINLLIFSQIQDFTY
jgi:hypothetical protein